MNKIALIGNLTRDPVFYTTEAGTKYALFTLAVNRLNDGVDFINCKAWDKRAETIAQYVKKGNKLGVVGRLEINKSEKDGVTTYHHSVVVEDFDFLTPKSENQTDSYQQIQERNNEEVPTGNNPTGNNPTGNSGAQYKMDIPPFLEGKPVVGGVVPF